MRPLSTTTDSRAKSLPVEELRPGMVVHNGAERVPVDAVDTSDSEHVEVTLHDDDDPMPIPQVTLPRGATVFVNA